MKQLDPVLVGLAEKVAEILRGAGLPSARVVNDSRGIRIEMDGREGVDAEYGGGSKITGAIMQVGGRPA